MPLLRILVVDDHAVARACADAGDEVVLAATDSSAAMIAVIAVQEAVDAVAMRAPDAVRAMLGPDVAVLDLTSDVPARLAALRRHS